MSWVAVGVAGATLVTGYMASDASENASASQANSANKASALQLAQLQKTQGSLQPWLSSGQMSLQQLSRLAGVPGYSADAQSNGVDYKGMQFASKQQLHDDLYKDYLSQVGRPDKVSEDAIQLAMQAATPSPSTGQGQDPLFGSLTKPFGMEDFQASPAYQFNLAEGEKAINKASAARGKFYAPSTLQDISKYSQGLASNEFQNAFGNYNTNLGNIWNRLYSLSGSGQNAAATQGGFGTTVASNVGNNMMGAGNAQAAGQVGSANAYSNAASSAYNNYMMQQLLSQNQQSSVPSGGGGIMPGAGDINRNNA